MCLLFAYLDALNIPINWGFSYNRVTMPIIKDYNLHHDFEDTTVPVERSGKVIKSSVLSLADDVVSPSQFSDDIACQDPDDVSEEVESDFFVDEVDVPSTSPVVDSPVVPSAPPVDESKIRQEVEQELKAHVDDLITAIDGLKTARDEVIQSAESQLIDLSMAVAEKVLQKQIEVDPSVIKSVVEDTFNKISGSDRITFKINPADTAVFNEFQTYVESRLIGVEKITIQQDGTIDQGGCIIETDLGFVDVTIREKLNIIAQTFNKVKSTL